MNAAQDQIDTRSAPPPSTLSPEQALERLMAGNKRYATNQRINEDFSATRSARSQSQQPFAAVLSCADSRISPELAFDQGPGSIFVLRLAGNFLNVDGLASLEYAVGVLGVPLVLVLGHTNCGAVDAAIDAAHGASALPGHLPVLVESIAPAVKRAKARTPEDLLLAATEENVWNAVDGLEGKSNLIAERVAEDRLILQGGIYDIASGRVRLI